MRRPSLTLADFIITSGALAATVLIRPRGDHRIAQWTDDLAGERGWWWALLPRDSETLLACGWSAGGPRDRDLDMALAIRRLVGREREAAS